MAALFKQIVTPGKNIFREVVVHDRNRCQKGQYKVKEIMIIYPDYCRSK